MVATVSIQERNGAPAGVETEIDDDLFFGNFDGYIFVPSDYPITPGNNSYEKYLWAKVTNLGGMTSVSAFKVWISGGDALGAETEFKTNARTAAYGGADAYGQPATAASAHADQDMPTSEPGTANIGIGGALAGIINSVPSYTDYVVNQIQTSVDETQGKAVTLTFDWTETP